MNDVWLKELAEEQTKRLLEYYIKLRKQHKLSQSELERITGVSRISINRYENGKIMPSVQAVNQLLVTMGYRLDIVPICDTRQTTAECMKESQVNKLHWNQQNLKQNNTICIQI